MKCYLAKQLVASAQSSIRRTLWVYGTIVVLFFSVMTVLWNLYFSWIRNLFSSLSNLKALTFPQSELFKVWTSSTFFKMPLLNIDIQISDASVIVSFAFFILVVWLFFSARRENHIIGKSLRLSLNIDNEMKKFIYYGISFSNLFSTISDRDDPIDSLEYKEKDKRTNILRKIVQLVFFAPTFAIVSIILMDIYSVFSLTSLFRDNNKLELYQFLTMNDFIKIVFMDTFALIIAIVCGFLAHKSWQFENCTNIVLKDFADNRIDWQ